MSKQRRRRKKRKKKEEQTKPLFLALTVDGAVAMNVENFHARDNVSPPPARKHRTSEDTLYGGAGFRAEAAQRVRGRVRCGG